MRYVIHYDIAALILAITLLLHFYHKKSIRQSQTYVYMWLIWMCLVTDILDIITILIDAYRCAAIPVYLINVIYLVAFNCLPFLYYLYLVMTLTDHKQWTVRTKVELFSPVGFSIFLIVTSPITSWVFYYNLEEGYTHGGGFPLLYVATVYYMIASIYTATKAKNRLTPWMRVSIYVYVLTSLFGILLQMLIPNVLIVQYAVSISLLFLYMSLESPEDDEDKRFALYNSNGFTKLVTRAVEKKLPFSVVGIQITNYQMLREAMGTEMSMALTQEMVSNLSAATKKQHATLCYLSEGKLAAILKTKEEAERFAGTAWTIVGQPVVAGGMNVQLEAVFLQMDYPDEVRTVEDILDALDFTPRSTFENKKGEVFHISGELLEEKKKENRILQVMQKALNEGTFQVYYQPIYSVKEKRITVAEALVRLRDEEMGFISPEFFIPMSEQNGMILKIGEFVFRSVCEMMARERIWEKGIDYIEVNLSVVQCMQEDICEMLYGIMDEYGIPYSAINFEITETTLANDVLWSIMERMTVGGSTFSLDDFGTGYSNLTNVFRYPFHLIKIDKSMVWSASDDEYAKKTLRHTMAMVQDLDKHIVAEGVETAEQLKMLEEMGCDYIQGYYFSRPVPEAEFLKKIAVK